eukprot:gene23002-46564_t
MPPAAGGAAGLGTSLLGASASSWVEVATDGMAAPQANG